MHVTWYYNDNNSWIEANFPNARSLTWYDFHNVCIILYRFPFLKSLRNGKHWLKLLSSTAITLVSFAWKSLMILIIILVMKILFYLNGDYEPSPPAHAPFPFPVRIAVKGKGSFPLMIGTLKKCIVLKRLLKTSHCYSRRLKPFQQSYFDLKMKYPR